MKMNKMLFKVILFALLIVVCGSCICYASNGLPSVNDEGYIPTISSGERSTTIISNILGALTVIGIIAIVISIALIGFGSILGSASQKAENQGKYVGLAIAATIITGGSIIARMIMHVAERL